MSNSDHFREFRVQNFKRFEAFEMHDLGQFNLIVGDNNVGKTSVLEALMVENNYVIFSKNLEAALTLFKNFDDLKEWFMLQYFDKHTKLKSVEMKFTVTTRAGQNLLFRLFPNSGTSGNYIWESTGNANISVHPNNFGLSSPPAKIPFLPFQLSYNHNLTQYYAVNIQTHNTKKERLIEDMKVIIPAIKYIEPNPAYSSSAVLTVSLGDRDANLPLGTFGDGVIKLFRFLIEMQIQSGKRLMIDEIDTGIHYSRMKAFWTTIIRSARNNDVQLFATTHNKECIQYFKEALDAEGIEIQKDARIIRLVEDKNKHVMAYTRTYEGFSQALESDNDLR